MSDLPLLARGRTADVFALDSTRVLRRYRDGGDVTAEATVMTYVGSRGFPIPRVEAAAGTDLIMERLDGPTMAEALLDSALDVDMGMRLLADLHTRLHALPGRASADPAARVVHLDLHPANVVLSTRGPVVIDWRNAGEGRAELDVALTALIMAEVAVDPSATPTDQVATAVRSFLAHAGVDLGQALPEAAARRFADPSLSLAEKRRLPAAVALVNDADRGD